MSLLPDRMSMNVSQRADSNRMTPKARAIVVCFITFGMTRAAILLLAPFLFGDMDWRKDPWLSASALGINYVVALLFAGAEYRMASRWFRRNNIENTATTNCDKTK